MLGVSCSSIIILLLSNICYLSLDFTIWVLQSNSEVIQSGLMVCFLLVHFSNLKLLIVVIFFFAVSNWMHMLLPLALERGTCIITNMGASKNFFNATLLIT